MYYGIGELDTGTDIIEISFASLSISLNSAIQRQVSADDKISRATGGARTGITYSLTLTVSDITESLLQLLFHGLSQYNSTTGAAVLELSPTDPAIPSELLSLPDVYSYIDTSLASSNSATLEDTVSTFTFDGVFLNINDQNLRVQGECFISGFSPITSETFNLRCILNNPTFTLIEP